jgi:hypothetical protein
MASRRRPAPQRQRRGADVSPHPHQAPLDDFDSNFGHLMADSPMRGTLRGKRIAGYLWAGPGSSWKRRKNYKQLEDDEIVSATFAGKSGAFTVRAHGTTCVVTVAGPRGRILSTVQLTLPHGRKR